MNNKQRIAIIGMGAAFPGADDLSEFWENILAGRDCSREPPPGRWLLSLEDVYAPGGPAPDKVYSRRACFVDDFPLNTAGLLLEEGLLISLDPAFSLLLHAGRQAWDDAATAQLDKARVGLVIGNIVLPTESASNIAAERLLPLFEQAIFGETRTQAKTDTRNRYAAALPAGLLARALGLGGGSYTLDAACASSLYSLKYAVDELQAGRADAMLCGGLSRPDSLYTQMGFSALHAISASGRCAPFDHKADGLVVGEGCGILMLKRLDDALAAGDQIHAVIAGAGLSNDIGGNLMSPDSEGQCRAMRAAYAQAGWQPGDVDLIECHGTGTPVGDAVEFNSLLSLWDGQDKGKRKGQNDSQRNGPKCVIGSVKSNVGHLLTAAGAAGLIKVLLALRHDTLPPTANFTRPPASIALGNSPFQVLSEPQAWARRAAATPRRAAISAFGFGGINAHVLLEEWRGQAAGRTERVLPQIKSAKIAERGGNEEIAIIGMDAHFGPWASLQDFRQRIFAESGRVEPTEVHGWGQKGAARAYQIDQLAIPLGRFRIPPNELKDMLPQQLLMLQVAAKALEDAGISAAKSVLRQAGVYVGIGLDLNTTNFHLRWALLKKAREWTRQHGLALDDAELEAWTAALRTACNPPLTANRTMGALGGIVASRIARAFAVGGPSFTLSNEECSGLRAVAAAVRALQRGEIDMAIVGAVDFSADLRAVPGWREDVMGEGAAALILKRRADAARNGDRIYSLIRGLGGAGGADAALPFSATYVRAARRCLQDGAVALDSIGLVEAQGSSDTAAKQMEAEALGRLFAKTPREIPCALGNVQADAGYTGAAGGLAALVKVSLALYHQRIPAWRGHDPAGATPAGDVLYAPTESHYWLRNRSAGPRRALLASFSVDGNCLAAVLEEAGPAHGQIPAVPVAVGAAPAAMFSVCADTPEELLTALKDLRRRSQSFDAKGIHALARQWWRQQAEGQAARLAVSILAGDVPQLSALLDTAEQAVAGGRAVMAESLSYTPEPLAAGKLAFVFPGSGMHFAGMGREMSRHWPEILHRLDEENAALASQFAGLRFWAGDDVARLSQEDYLFGQVWLGTMVSDVIAGFGIRPDAVLGYSLGETVGLFATRTWRARDLMLQRMRTTSLFSRELGGPCEAAKKSWNSKAPVNWRVGVVDRPAAEVRERLAGRARVYLLIVNTPTECVIGGDAAAVQALVQDMRCGFHPLRGVTTVHCEVVKPVAEDYRSLHRFATTPPAGVDFYSAAKGGRFAVTTESAADSITRQALATFDYTRLVNAAYEDGVRLFIEMGPGMSCTRMIGQILEPRPHFARSACVPGQSDVGNVLQILARLNAERIPLQLDSLYADRGIDGGQTVSSVEQAQILIPVGKPALTVPPPPCPAAAAPQPSRQAAQTAKLIAPPAIAPPVVARGAAHPVADPPTVAAEISAPPAIAAVAIAATHGSLAALIGQMAATETAKAEAQATFLRVSSGMNASLAQALSTQLALLQAAPASRARPSPPPVVEEHPPAPAPQTQARPSPLPVAKHPATAAPQSQARPSPPPVAEERPSVPAPQTQARPSPPPTAEHPPAPARRADIAFDRGMCLEFATGSIAEVLGSRFAAVDSYPTRVRLPDEPLMLVDRVMQIEGAPASLRTGRVVTEHDVLPGAWYLDGGRIPVCIAVEAGQADLFLSAWLGIDLQTKGLAVYRLLDAEVTFHAPLPEPGQVIRYDIHIERFFRQGDTWLFRFRFDGTVAGAPLISMRRGCAGFFTQAELEAGRGIVQTALETQAMPGRRADDWHAPVPMEKESYSDAQLEALREGDLAACFGARFAGLPLKNPARLPGGRMTLVHRIVALEPEGGRFGIGQITGEADIHPDDWFLRCHFVDDQVMPGTLMYECCLHTLRVYLLRLGWVGEADAVVYEPMPGISSQLKCRGQVLPGTRRVKYEISIREIGYLDDGTPYVLADALMYADGRAIVQIGNMSLRLSGLSRQGIESIWEGAGQKARQDAARAAPAGPLAAAGQSLATTPAQRAEPAGPLAAPPPRKALFDHASIRAFAVGRPSVAFGEKYRIFDEERVIARLPGPPFQFLDRIVSIADCEQWQLAAGGRIEAEYEVPPDAWYFTENRQDAMPFSVLLEVALQPCGWLAAYLGSALTSEVDLSFRNLGGAATQFLNVTPASGTLTTKVRITKVSRSGGMIIQHYDFDVYSAAGPVYQGNTYFGFFTKAALAQQVGIRAARLYTPSAPERQRGTAFPYPDQAPYPQAMLRMVDEIELFDPVGGPQGLGFISGSAHVNPEAWFFKAHFYQDPVWPGSLGLESLLQLLKVVAWHHWGAAAGSAPFETMALNAPHSWVYRGQITPKDSKVSVQAVITELDHARKQLKADGFLAVDGRIIYQMKDFALTMPGL